MKARMEINGQTAEVSLGASGRFRYSEQGSSVEGEASVIEVEAGMYSVLWGGRCYEVRVKNGVVEVGTSRFQITVADPREMSSSGARSGGPGHVTAPMPGKVIRVLVDAGQQVEAGQGVVVVEAMKMQNEIEAPRAGRVASICVTQGAAVAAGEILATID